MNKKAFFAMSYGVYVTTSVDGNKLVGCITNSNTQVASSPAMVSVSVNHGNYTTGCIERSGLFGFTVLSVKSDPDIIGRFGFRSSEDTDKFEGLSYEMKEGVPVLKDGCAYGVCRVVGKIETETHTVFMGEVIDADLLRPEEPMTYAYYHNVLKGKSPSKAPTYAEEEKTPAKEPDGVKRYVCDVCGYVYEGDSLPEGFRCPLCGVDSSHFKEESPAKGFICDVCGYVYEGDSLPNDFRCPVCGVDITHFEKV